MKLVLKDHLSKQHMSIIALAERLGVHRNTVHGWMRNPQSIKMSHALKLCEILHCSLNDLFEQEEQHES